jgi:glyoxylase-like metal-dependent hydrolase (beta-lactamase superfamily II)
MSPTSTFWKRDRVRPSPKPEDLGDGVWSVPVPIPGSPLGYTLVYALESAKGLTLIDAGWNHPDAWAALHGGMSALGLDVADVQGVVVTHYHADHAGLAARVRDASGAWIAMHHADAEVVRLLHDRVREGVGRTFASIRQAGAEAGEEEPRPADHIDPPAIPDRELSDGDLVDLPGRKLRAVWTPGHTPGHLCLHLEDGDRIFTGDHVLPRITPHIGLYPYDLPDVDPLGDFLASLERVATIEAGEVLPAHQYRFSGGVAGRAAEIAAHHEDRLVEITGLLSDRPATLWELAGAMKWRTAWEAMSPISRQMATGEAAAHLRTLERRGGARRFGLEAPISFVLT